MIIFHRLRSINATSSISQIDLFAFVITRQRRLGGFCMRRYRCGWIIFLSIFARCVYGLQHKRYTTNNTTHGNSVLLCITKTSLIKYTEKFTSKKWKFSDKNSDFFLISAQNIDCGYSLEPPRRGGSNKYPQSMFWAEIRKIMYTPVNPIYYIKVGFKGVKII